MFNKILVALHGSEPGQTVAKMIGSIKNLPAEVTVLNVLETGLSHYGYVDTLASSVSKSQFIKYVQQQAEEQKERAYELLISSVSDTGLQYNFITAQGKPGPEIHKEAETGQYDLVILGKKESLSIGNTSTKTREYLAGRLGCSLFMFN